MGSPMGRTAPWGEEEQGSGVKLSPQAEAEQSGLCDDERDRKA